jgi:hypothetical protein
MAKGHVRNDSDDPLTRNRKLEEALLRASLAFDAKLSDFGVTFLDFFLGDTLCDRHAGRGCLQERKLENS